MNTKTSDALNRRNRDTKISYAL